jgi:SAM-dependent MidA family methyltransferase
MRLAVCTSPGALPAALWPSPIPRAPPTTERKDASFPPGTVTETHGQSEAFITTLAKRMTQGAAFFLDYGFTKAEAEYDHHQRHGGTLMCHHLHTSVTDPLVGVGAKNITAQVNFAGIALAGQEAGWEVIGLVKGPWFDAIGFAQGNRTHTL